MRKERTCRRCGDPIPYGGRGRPRVYCTSCSATAPRGSVVRSERTCEHCGTTFTPPAAGRLPKYCSTRCRRDHCVRVGACADCGVEIVRTNGDALPERCQECSSANRSAIFAASEKRAELIRLYKAGTPLTEIKERLGYTRTESVAIALYRLRKWYGIDVGYRYEIDENGRRTSDVA